jgi:DNA-directed RNA polymerase specialized sigma24 family protein
MPPSDDDPPKSDPRPIADEEEEPVSGESAPGSGANEPRKDGDEGRKPRKCISIAVLRAYLSRRDTQRHIRNVVAGALGDQATRPLVDDLANDAQMEALTARELAETVESMPAWVDGVARNTVRAYFRATTSLRRRFVPLLDVQALEDAAEQAERAAEEDDGRPPVTAPELYAEAVDEAPRWLLAAWLRDRTREEPQERELLDMLREKAKTKKSIEQIAQERGTTAMAVYQRIQRLRRKYRDGWIEYKRRRDRMLLLFLALLLVAVAAWLAWSRPWRALSDAPPTEPPQPLVPPAPSVTAAPTTAPFPQALPPPSDAPQPQRVPDKP